MREFAAAPLPEDPSQPPLLWQYFQQLPVARDQERAYEMLAEVHGDSWVDEAAINLPHASPGMVRPLVDGLQRAGRKDDLLVHYGGLLARPLRAPALLVTLARVFESGLLPEGFATAPQRVHALLTLASNLNEARRGNAFLTRVHQRLADLLTSGAKPLLRRLLADSDAATLRSLQTVLARGVDPQIDGMMTDIALEKDRHFFAHELVPYWQGNSILTTRSGLNRRYAELHELREVKIPANQDAIGRAASFGDLSENSEWEAAIAEQRNLTQRAMEIEAELRSAELIENAAMPEDTACPGARVRYLDLGSDREHQIQILGPWDDHLGEDVVSYRAPLAAGLLGKHPGEEANLELPGGKIHIRLVAVAPVELV
jgi:transcription elongation factor GreA